MTAATKTASKPVPVCKLCDRRIYTRGLCALHWCSRGDEADPA